MFHLLNERNRFPFDWNNPFGYLIAVILQVAPLLISLHHVACLLSLALGAFLFTVTTEGFMKTDLKSIIKMANANKSESDIFEQLTSVVRTHGRLKQLSVYQLFISSLFD